MKVTRTLLAPTETEVLEIAAAAFSAVENCKFLETLKSDVAAAIKPLLGESPVITITEGKKCYSQEYDYVTETYYVTVTHPRLPTAHGQPVWQQVSEKTHHLPDGVGMKFMDSYHDIYFLNYEDFVQIPPMSEVTKPIHTWYGFEDQCAYRTLSYSARQATIAKYTPRWQEI